KRTVGRIVETEAYRGEEDKACHAHVGRTARTEGLYAPAGTSYVYLCYGVHWLLNVCARSADLQEYPAAVLIRAVEPVAGLEHMAARRTGRKQREWTNGPGKLTTAMGIDGTHHGIDVTLPGSPVYLEASSPVPPAQIATGPRIGINPPEPWKSIPWRFWVDGSRYVSR
ncbi:MAG: DNA-3-methyladenine glycosylase, partial [Anaerolineae bacterium]